MDTDTPGIRPMTPEERQDAHVQIMDDILFLCYYWGTAPAAAIPVLRTRQAKCS